MIRNLLFQITLLIGLAGCAHSLRDSGSNDVIVVRVEPRGNLFGASFELPRDSRVWAFHRSALRRSDRQPWRPDSWSVKTPGVRLSRIGQHDVLIDESGGMVPRRVEIEFQPAAVDLIADYDPALKMDDGTVAIFSGAFNAFPAADPDALDRDSGSGTGVVSQIIMSNPGGKVFHDGQYVERAVLSDDTYVIFGDVDIDPSLALPRLYDSDLPQWLAMHLDLVTPLVFETYENRLGAYAGQSPLMLASYEKSAEPIISQGGSVLPGLIVLAFAGAGLATPDYSAKGRATWFIAHEAAHFWLGNSIRYDSPDRAWITEGGADFMAMRAAGKIGDGFDAERFSAQAISDCVAAIELGGIESARFRNEQRPYYACGMVFAQVVDRAGQRRDRDFFDFVRLLLETDIDKQVTRAEWFAAAENFGVSAQKIEIMRKILVEPADDGADIVEALLRETAFIPLAEGVR